MADFMLMCYGHSISSPLTDFTYKYHPAQNEVLTYVVTIQLIRSASASATRWGNFVSETICHILVYSQYGHHLGRVHSFSDSSGWGA